MASDALLLGRVTYDGFAPVWPHVEGEFADKFNTMPKYVVSSTLENPEWNNTTVLRGDVIEEVGKLKAQYDGDIVVHGSPQLAQTLIEHDLVDELASWSTRSSSAPGSASSPRRAARSVCSSSSEDGRRRHPHPRLPAGRIATTQSGSRPSAPLLEHWAR